MKKGKRPWIALGINPASYYRALRQGKDPSKIVPRGPICKNPFRSLRVASKAARKLGIKTKAEYRRRYSENPRLPVNPNLKYPGFRS